MAGRPDANHPTTQKRQEEKRNLRKAQRINGAIERKKTYSEIMKASKEDSKLFYKLVNKQRCTATNATSEISYNDENFNAPSQYVMDFTNISEIWQFQKMIRYLTLNIRTMLNLTIYLLKRSHKMNK